MHIIDQSNRPDYALGYYIICVISFVTCKKVKRIEKLKLKLKEKEESSSNRNI